MIPRIMRVGLVFWLSMALTGMASADTTQSPQAMLKEMAAAVRAQNYEGRFIYMRGDGVSTLQVMHAVFDGQEYERITHLDGQHAEVIRDGSDVVLVHPDNTITRLDEAFTSGPFSLSDKLASMVPRQYEVLLDGDSRVAGRSAWRLRLSPMDKDRYGYLIWVDKHSHLLLRSQLVDGNGVALEQVEFVSLNTSPNLKRSQFQAPRAAVEERMPSTPATPAAGDNIDIAPTWLPAGFEEADRDLRRVLATGHPVESVTYSDGLATFTLFLEQAGAQSREGVSQMGPTVAASRLVHLGPQPYALTLVGEIPEATAQRILGGIQIKRPGS